jgi:SAM-dependent methyltransferase
LKIEVRKVLEIGCAPGPYLLELAKHCYAFAGLDPSEAMLEYSLETAPVNFVGHKIIDRTIVEVINDGKTKIFITEKIDRVIFLQEFVELVEKNGRFKFVVWCYSFDLAQPLEKAAKFSRPITLLRRK